MLEHLPEFLAGLFLMLSDSMKDIRQQADACLAEFLREISEVVEVNFGEMVPILVDQCQAADKPGIIRTTGLTWLCEFVRLARHSLTILFPEMVRSSLQCFAKFAKYSHTHLLTCVIPCD